MGEPYYDNTIQIILYFNFVLKIPLAFRLNLKVSTLILPFASMMIVLAVRIAISVRMDDIVPFSSKEVT